MTDDPYCYPNGTLRNRFGIADPGELADAEQALVVFRSNRLARTPVAGSFDLDHLRAIHRYLFQDVYGWAGELRTVEISKGDVLFCLARLIEPAAVDVFAAVPAVLDQLRSSGGHDLSLLAELYGDINSLHPFREGNGRAQREYLRQLAAAAEVCLDWSHISADGNVAASIAASHGDNSGLHAALRLAAGLAPLPEHADWTERLGAG